MNQKDRNRRDDGHRHLCRDSLCRQTGGGGGGPPPPQEGWGPALTCPRLEEYSQNSKTRETIPFFPTTVQFFYFLFSKGFWKILYIVKYFTSWSGIKFSLNRKMATGKVTIPPKRPLTSFKQSREHLAPIDVRPSI